MYKILNLYAGIGGNRKDWADVNVTAVESNPNIGDVYAQLFPTDAVIVADAKAYLLEHYQAFDFIWASPPCQSHSRMRQFMNVRQGRALPIYPDMTLYQLIIFLQQNVNTPWVVENVKPYYNPLIQPTFALGRHCFWSNVSVPHRLFGREGVIGGVQVKEKLTALYEIDIDFAKGIDKRTVLKNCVHPSIGNYVWSHAKKAIKTQSCAEPVCRSHYTQLDFIDERGVMQCCG